MDSAHGHWSARAAAIIGLFFLAAQAEAEVSLDPTFGVDGVVRTDFGSGNSDTPRDLLIQPDGMILTAGISVAYSGEWFVAISRHSANGVIDYDGFGIDGEVLQRFVMRDHANAIALQEDGRIVAVGMQMTSAGVSTQTPSVYRFHADGTVDTTFGDSGYVAVWSATSTGENAAVKVLPDGSILVGGRRQPGYNGGIYGFAMRRYLSDGTLMMASTREFLIDYNRGSCAFPDDGKILFANIAFLNGRHEFVMARFDSLGNPDAGFGTNGVVQTGIEAVFNTDHRVLALSDGKILLAGTTPRDAGHSKWTVLRFHSNGTLDTLFGTNGRTDVTFGDGINEQCIDAAVDADGKILLAGQASSIVGGLPGLARLLLDGGMDSTFSGDGKFTVDLNGPGGTHYLTRVRILPDGRILSAGFDFSSNGGDFFLARFFPSDPTGIDAAAASPTRMSIHASPNPSYGETTVRFQLAREQVVNVAIFDVAGRGVRRVFDGTLAPGTHLIPWDGRDEAGRETSVGVYFTRVSTSEEKQTTKLIRVR